MFEVFSPEARRAIVAAQEVSRAQRRQGIRTEAILVALSLVPGSESAAVLAQWRDQLECTHEDRQRRSWMRLRRSPDHIPFTINSKQVIADVARRRGPDVASTSDLLASLVQTDCTSARAWLDRHGATPAALCDLVAASPRWEARDVTDEMFEVGGPEVLAQDHAHDGGAGEPDPEA